MFKYKAQSDFRNIVDLKSDGSQMEVFESVN